MSEPAQRWLDGEISTGKLCELLKVNRIDGEKMLGALWQALHEKVSEHRKMLEGRRSRAVRDWTDATKDEDKAAEAAMKHAYTDALAQFQMAFGQILANTSNA